MDRVLTATSPALNSYITCCYCDKKGHIEKKCDFQKYAKRTYEHVYGMLITMDHFQHPKGLNNLLISISFFAPSGPTCYMCWTLHGMFNLKPYVTDITFGNSEFISCACIGNCKAIDLYYVSDT
jgi:hypothetical protein